MNRKQLYSTRPIRDLKDMLNQSVALFGNRPAFVKKNPDGSMSEITYNVFGNHVKALGTALLNIGLKGKPIAVIGENRYEWCVSYLAVVNGTGVVVPLDKELPENEIASLLDRSDSNAVFCSGEYLDVLLRLKPGLPKLKKIICFDLAKSENDEVLSFSELTGRGKELISNGDNSFVNAAIDNEAMSMLIFTSGTTEQSKGVILYALVAKGIYAKIVEEEPVRIQTEATQLINSTTEIQEEKPAGDWLTILIVIVFVILILSLVILFYVIS